MKYLIVSGVMASVLLVGTWQLNKPANVSTESHSSITQTDEPAQRVLPEKVIEQTVNKNDDAIPAAVLAQLPGSLKGAPLPMPLAVGQDGLLIIDDKVRKLFDFYLTAIGEESLSVIVARIKLQLTRQLQSPALEQALDILKNYLSYRNQLALLLQQQDADGPRSYEQLSLLRAQIADLRVQLFETQVVEVFFAAQDQYDQYMLARANVQQADYLSVEQKAKAQQMLDANTPQWLLAQQQKADELNRYREKAEQLVKAGQLNAARDLAAQTFGVAAADRLEQLRLKRERWQQNLSAYHVKLKSLLQNSGLDDYSRADSIAQLRSEYFTPSQLKRVAAIDGVKFNL